MPPKKLLFLTLNTFSSTGGIETVCRVAGKALQETVEAEGVEYLHFALNDKPGDLMTHYVSLSTFRPFSGSKTRYAAQAIATGRGCDVVILSHINLLVIGWMIKFLSPKTKVFLLAHGIEVWVPLPSWKKRMLGKLDRILPVSEFTKEKMKTLYGLDEDRLAVLNNCLDPFLTRKLSAQDRPALRNKHGFSDKDIVLFTLTRLKSSEQYKGYDKVIRALPEVLKRYPTVKYLIGGKYDAEEKARLDQLVSELQLQDQVFFSGFVPDEDVEGLFTLADVYAMPSTGEGFGIVFIEALFYGLPVIAGNVDGSVDALDNGRFGLLMDPNNPVELREAICSAIEKRKELAPRAEAVADRFGFERYKEKLKAMISTG
ncbi:MAG: glycosyltransferase family 1 protein [Sphingobacteriales bacterium]|nr:MAG: glycosyltransferase family 1 protein [Sphingobacteriales bacterium]